MSSSPVIEAQQLALASSGDMIRELLDRGYVVFPRTRVEPRGDCWIIVKTGWERKNLAMEFPSAITTPTRYGLRKPNERKADRTGRSR